MVEVTGLEPTTSWSLTKRATKLRYTSFLTYSFEPRSFLRPLGPRRSPRYLSALRFCAPLDCTFGRSSSQKSRFAAIFGSPIRARYQTALHLVFNLFFRTAVVSTTSVSSSLPSQLIRVALLRTACLYARSLLFPKISLRCDFREPYPCALPNCAISRCRLFISRRRYARARRRRTFCSCV